MHLTKSPTVTVHKLMYPSSLVCFFLTTLLWKRKPDSRLCKMFPFDLRIQTKGSDFPCYKLMTYSESHTIQIIFVVWLKEDKIHIFSMFMEKPRKSVNIQKLSKSCFWSHSFSGGTKVSWWLSTHHTRLKMKLKTYLLNTFELSIHGKEMPVILQLVLIVATRM